MIDNTEYKNFCVMQKMFEMGVDSVETGTCPMCGNDLVNENIDSDYIFATNLVKHKDCDGYCWFQKEGDDLSLDITCKLCGAAI